jgi:hypothetical protein
VLVAIIILSLIVLAIFGLSRGSTTKHSGGTSLRRTAASHINANGSPKRSYPSLDAARIAAQQQAAHTSQTMSAYKCSACRLYHIGHS